MEEEEGKTGETEAELDDALEREFNRPLGFSLSSQQEGPRPSSSPSPSAAAVASSSSAAARLTFSFPGWGVEIYRDKKRRNPSVIRHGSPDQDQDLKPNQKTSEDHRGAKLSLRCDDAGGSGNCMYDMPDEIISNVFRRLGIKDLCSAMQTCQWWQHLGIQDGIWEHVQADHEHTGSLKFSSNKKPLFSISLPRWAVVKNNALCDKVQDMASCSHGHLRKGFDHLRHVLRAWWVTGTLEKPYCSKAIQRLIRKMIVHDWTVLYEFLTISFTERADSLAASLLKEVEGEVIKRVQPICPFQCNHHHQHWLNDDESQLISRKTNFMDFSLKMPSSLRAMTSEEYQLSYEASVGQRLWDIVCVLWKHYKHWLMLVFEHCGGLNQEVMVEKARTLERNNTIPTLYEKGVICFRSQVLLKYGLRRILQLGFNELASNKGGRSETETRLLRSVYHLLEEVDVRDDSFSPEQFTQAKLRRCFPMNRSLDN